MSADLFTFFGVFPAFSFFLSIFSLLEIISSGIYAKKISQKNDFVVLSKSEDETLLYGECKGSGKKPYITFYFFNKKSHSIRNDFITYYSSIFWINFSTASSRKEISFCSGKKLYPFGESKLQEVADEMKIDVLAQLPIQSDIAMLCDAGKNRTSPYYRCIFCI